MSMCIDFSMDESSGSLAGKKIGFEEIEDPTTPRYMDL